MPLKSNYFLKSDSGSKFLGGISSIFPVILQKPLNFKIEMWLTIRVNMVATNAILAGSDLQRPKIMLFATPM